MIIEFKIRRAVTIELVFTSQSWFVGSPMEMLSGPSNFQTHGLKTQGFIPKTADGDGGFNIKYDGIGNNNKKLGTNSVASLRGAPTKP